MITADRVRELLIYEPETGRFIWRVDRYRKAKAGSEAGKVKSDNRRYIGLDYHEYQASKIAWLYMLGEWPDFIIDHENRDSSDDRWENLRRASSSENNQNCSLRSDNTSGAKGVSWNKRQQKWHAYFHIRSKMISLGFFEKFEEATEVATFAREFFFGEFYADVSNRST